MFCANKTDTILHVLQIDKLQKEARSRGVNLVLLPDQSTIRRGNMTRYIFKDKQIVWHIEWCFPKAEAVYNAK